MAKRIFRNVVQTSIIAVLLTAALIVSAMYSVYEKSMESELRQEAGYIIRALEMTDDEQAYFQDFHSDNRITLITSDGTVIYDSAADAAQMENHAERPEVAQAFSAGHGESTRTSETVSEVTIYYAQRMNDDMVLRIANTRSSIIGAFAGVMPLIIGMLLCVVLVSLLIARRAAKRIVDPINALNLEQPLENEAYDELAPLLTRMEKQHIQIHEHVNALENARAELAAIMANMREGMILLDANDHILSMNESAARIFGTASDTHIGQNLLAVSRDANLHELVQSAFHGEGSNMLMNRNGRHYRIYASPVMQNAIVRGTVLLVLDVTERFAAEESRREFTANVSHELKTPLTSISGFAEIIRDGIAQPQDVSHFAGMICKEAARLISLVNDILELSQLDEKQNFGRKENVALLPLLQELIDDFTALAQKKNLSLILSGHEAQIEGYPLMLREMFFNLIDNAVKYTPDHGTVSLEIKKEGNAVRCTVADTGIGIPKEHQAHVFERFYRVDKSHSRATGGTGLGLAIVKHISQIHHAELTLHSIEGKGTSVTLSFPE